MALRKTSGLKGNGMTCEICSVFVPNGKCCFMQN